MIVIVKHCFYVLPCDCIVFFTMEESDQKIIFIKSRKGKTTLLRGGYKYNLSLQNKNGTSLWRCCNRDICSATITCKDKHFIRQNRRSHTCDPNYLRNQIDLAMDKCKQDVCKDFGSVQKIFEKNLEDLRNHQNVEEIPEFRSKKTACYKARKDFLNVSKLTFNRLEDVQISEVLVDNFFVCEDGDVEKILLFASPTAKKFAKNYNGIFMGMEHFHQCHIHSTRCMYCMLIWDLELIQPTLFLFFIRYFQTNRKKHTDDYLI